MQIKGLKLNDRLCVLVGDVEVEEGRGVTIEFQLNNKDNIHLKL